MPYKLNKKLSSLKPYDPIEGEYKIRLDANESYFNLNKIFCEKISKEISKIDLNRYPDPYATAAVKAFADFYEIDGKYVTAGNGSDELISIITSCFLESGDKILTLSPDFSMYAFYGSLYELQVEFMQKEDDLSINIDKVIDFCQSNEIKALIFSNPCNPTSLGVKREDILKLISNVQALVILDEAYMDFWTESILDKIGEFDNLIILKTCSKAIGLASIRMGFAVAGETISKALKAAKSPYNTDAVSQAICKCVLGEKDFLKNQFAEIIKNRDKLYLDILNLSSKYPVIEKVYETKTNFVFLKTSKSGEIFSKLLENSISIRKIGEYLRITTGSCDENAEFLKVFEQILKNI